MFDRKTLRGRINLTIALVMVITAVLFGSILAVHEIRRREAAQQQIEQLLRELAAQYELQLGNAVFNAEIKAVEGVLQNILQRKGVLAVGTYDDKGAPLLVLGLNDAVIKPKVSLDVSLLAKAYTIAEVWRGRSVLTYTKPIEHYGEVVGFWRIRYSLEKLNNQTLELAVIFSLMILLPFTLIFFLLNRILVRFVWSPVFRLKDTMEIAREGENRTFSGESGSRGFENVDQMIHAVDTLLQGYFGHKGGDNEITSLALSFRHMLAELKKAYAGSRTDILTGLSNRMKLDELLEAERSRCLSQGTTFSILLLDIDKFKIVNDTYGHLTGDEVLKTLAGLLRGFFRKGDTPGRWGGEEFLVLLPGLDSQEAGTVARRLREAVASARFDGPENCTASIGVAQYRPHESLEELISRVDAALYGAKEAGRDRVVVSD